MWEILENKQSKRSLLFSNSEAKWKLLGLSTKRAENFHIHHSQVSIFLRIYLYMTNNYLHTDPFHYRVYGHELF